MIDPSALRTQTVDRLSDAGFPQPPAHLPVLWEGSAPAPRPPEQVVQRIAVLNVIVTCAYGMPPALACDWIGSNGLLDHLTDRERRVVAGELGRVEEDKIQVEAIHALCWTLGVVGSIDPEVFCPNDLAARLPDLRSGESLADWLKRTAVSPPAPEKTLGEWDLHYCITWAIADANLHRTDPPGPLPQYVYWQRRRAFEFIYGGAEILHQDWDSIDLST
jgi:hypothetical protein